MFFDENKYKFGDLPADLIDEIIGSVGNVGEQIAHFLKEISNLKNECREKLEKEDFVLSDSSYNVKPPTTCGIDGAYAIENTPAFDLLICAAIGVEGLGPPYEQFWEKPHHDLFVTNELHRKANPHILRAIMTMLEVKLASSAPHEVVFIDGALTSPLITFRQALNRLRNIQGKENNLISKFKELEQDFISNYENIIYSKRSDKVFVAIPKTISHREIGKKLGLSLPINDRMLLNYVLNPGEYTKPLPIESFAKDAWYKVTLTNGKEKSFKDALTQAKFIFYKPYEHSLPVRLEFAGNVSEEQIVSILKAVKEQLEPRLSPSTVFPLYLADRYVKEISVSMKAKKQLVISYCINKGIEAAEIIEALYNFNNNEYMLNDEA